MADDLVLLVVEIRHISKKSRESFSSLIMGQGKTALTASTPYCQAIRSGQYPVLKYVWSLVEVSWTSGSISFISTTIEIVRLPAQSRSGTYCINKKYISTTAQFFAESHQSSNDICGLRKQHSRVFEKMTLYLSETKIKQRNCTWKWKVQYFKHPRLEAQ